MKKRITLSDVAAAAGVSKMTASRALRGTGDVSRSSMEKVGRAAKEIGYVGNHLAMSLASRRSDLIGVVVPSFLNVVFAEVLSGIAESLDGSGMQPVFGVTDYDPDREYEIIRNMLSWNPAGLIITGLDQPDETLQLLENADVPVVQIMDLDGTPVDACVGLSHHAAGASMAEALIAKGRRRFGYVGCGLDRDTRARKRFTGFKEALSAHGLALKTTWTGPGPSTVKAGREFTAQVLETHPELDCIYYSNDDLAVGGAFHCIAAGINVPEALVIAGFNGLDLVESLPVRIATSRTPRREIGNAAARIILGSDRDDPATGGTRTEFRPEIETGL
ncbi:LacI family DNA-binding transcriptional regulator [Labrenzia sp. 011]|uniref:LacI family DNA-binding transcriptional regulator n=1 Tax=Labrenzia sp. 011 TaxID=2171494 RepID=UPI000D51DBDB|nr:LacI family DNA-binding transcriptional regulator [Labrenzia sp. 011]PVB60962.1 LacI family transcriptional regulator [Labrenzia sp. 011]